MGKCVSFKCIRDLAKVLEDSKEDNKELQDDVMGIFSAICDGITEFKMNQVGYTIKQEAAKELVRELGVGRQRSWGACYGSLGNWLSNFITQRLTNSKNVKTAYCQALRDPRTMPMFQNDTTALGCLASLASWIAPHKCEKLPMGYTIDENITVDDAVIKLSDKYQKDVGIFCNGLELTIDENSKEDCNGFIILKLYYSPAFNANMDILIKAYDKVEWKNQQDGIAKLHTLIDTVKTDITKLIEDSFTTVSAIVQLAVKNRATFMDNFEDAIKSGKNLADGGIRRVIMYALLAQIAEFWKAGGKSACDADAAQYRDAFYAGEPSWECVKQLFRENVPCPDKENMPLASPYKVKANDPRAAAFVPSLTTIAPNIEAAIALVNKLDDGQFPKGTQCDDVHIVSVIKVPEDLPPENLPLGGDPGDVIIVYRYCPAQIWSTTAPVGCDRAKVYALMQRLTDMLNATRLPSSYSPLWPTVKNWMPTQLDSDHTIAHPVPGGTICHYSWPMVKGNVPIGPGGDGGVPSPDVVPDQCFIYPRVFTTQDVYNFIIDAWIINGFLQNTTYDGRTWDDKYRNKIEPKLEALKKKIDEACT